ncbi:FAD-dependent oxidoreductase [Dyadobacter koreensis]|uniref:FAD-dependent oxidoreductase n=1 Tax=Dyadobacter koreensis TaxID=408657 RepID=UPI00286D7F64|nr:FAD-dependent oxidoreductase [Dyadobacter koreensis]
MRESLRIEAVFTVKEEHVGAENREMVTGKKEGNKAAEFYDSVGVGYYHIDLHPSTAGDTYIDLVRFLFRFHWERFCRKKWRIFFPQIKTSAPNISPTVVTACIRWNGVSVNRLVY